MIEDEFDTTIDDALREYQEQGLVPDDLEERIEAHRVEGNYNQALELLREHGL